MYLVTKTILNKKVCDIAVSIGQINNMYTLMTENNQKEIVVEIKASSKRDYLGNKQRDIVIYFNDGVQLAIVNNIKSRDNTIELSMSEFCYNCLTLTKSYYLS